MSRKSSVVTRGIRCWGKGERVPLLAPMIGRIRHCQVQGCVWGGVAHLLAWCVLRPHCSPFKQTSKACSFCLSVLHSPGPGTFATILSPSSSLCKGHPVALLQQWLWLRSNKEQISVSHLLTPPLPSTLPAWIPCGWWEMNTCILCTSAVFHFL